MRKCIRGSVFVRDIQAAWVAGGYLVVALIWIWGSDYLVGLIAAGNARVENQLQSVKGTVFVLVTAAGLYAAIALANARQRRLAEGKRLVEEMLLVSARLEALGTATGSLVHDFNNVLTVIRGVADLMKLENFDHNTMPVHLAAIEQAAEQATQMTHEMMLFMRDAPVAFAAVGLDAVLQEALPVLKRTAGRKVELTLKLHGALPPVRCARAQVERCLLNLVINARDALENVPEKRIRLGIAEQKLQRYTSLFCHKPVTGSHVVVTVEDTGCGIPREHVVRIFAPFFTTKPAGKGNGMGLTSVLKVMQMHGGWVEVDSRPGRGSRFSLFFPVASAGSAARENGSPGRAVSTGS